jgi:gamma-glutamylaminecyclotransferase
MTHPLFVYGTLKRGGSNHRFLAGEKFVAEARLRSGYRMFDVGGHPGLVPDPSATYEIEGELWSVSDSALATLDDFEGVAENLYRRELLPLAVPTGSATANCYLYARAVTGLRDVGACWRE